MVSKKHIYILLFTLFFFIFIYIIISYFNDDNYIENTSNDNLIINNNYNTWSEVWNYFNSEISNESEKIEKLEEKLEKEWMIVWVKYYFDKYWFKDNEKKDSFKINSNINLEIDATNTWLADWNSLNLSIPWASLDSLIKIPWRYKYSIYFNKWWEQEIIIRWNSLNNWKITKIINLK